MTVQQFYRIETLLIMILFAVTVACTVQPSDTDAHSESSTPSNPNISDTDSATSDTSGTPTVVDTNFGDVTDTASSSSTDSNGTPVSTDSLPPHGTDTDHNVVHDFFDIMAGGYVFAGDWNGYAWTSSGTVPGASITPSHFGGYTGSETRMCVSGTLATSYSSVGIWGMSVNQVMASDTVSDPPVLQWTPPVDTSGVFVNISRTEDTVIRLALGTADGRSYCTPLPDGPRTVLWNHFRENCWEGGGAIYDLRPITQVMLIVPGDESTPVSFAFCMHEIYPQSGLTDTDVPIPACDNSGHCYGSCFGCAANQLCATSQAACSAHAGCAELQNCVSGCSNDAGWTACYEHCGGNSGTQADLLLQEFWACIYCGACKIDCAEVNFSGCMLLHDTDNPVDTDVSNDHLSWQSANLSWYQSYPEPGSDECLYYNGCLWAGYFAGLPNQMPESWVAANNIIAVHENHWNTYRGKTLRVRQGTRWIDAIVYDKCADSDCSGCCTRNMSQTGFLIDMEIYTLNRMGGQHGLAEFACLDCP